jgi:hypothetical protein
MGSLLVLLLRTAHRSERRMRWKLRTRNLKGARHHRLSTLSSKALQGSPTGEQNLPDSHLSFIPDTILNSRRSNHLHDSTNPSTIHLYITTFQEDTFSYGSDEHIHVKYRLQSINVFHLNSVRSRSQRFHSDFSLSHTLLATWGISITVPHVFCSHHLSIKRGLDSLLSTPFSFVSTAK